MPKKKTAKTVVKSRRPKRSELFGRVASILEQARSGIVRSVNCGTVLAYWLIGREIVHELQANAERAEYGKQIIEELSEQLTQHYGDGYSVSSLKDFRQFYLTFSDRIVPEIISHPVGGQFKEVPIGPPLGAQFESVPIRYPLGSGLSEKPIRHPVGAEFEIAPISHPLGGQFSEFPIHHPVGGELKGFHPNLSWSHYRALMRVEDAEARDFYESEAVAAGWSKRDLERQIQSQYYFRLLRSKNKKGMLTAGRKGRQTISALDMLKDPVVLEFLELPDVPQLHETHLETAIVNNVQNFLLEFGRGFAFVARQKRLRFDDEDFYVDLVLYNYILKCFVLIDLKLGKLTHQDIGQMDSYVRMFDEQYRVRGDKAAIGLVLCSQKNDAVARYSVLNESKQLFAAKYQMHLPSEEELRNELQRQRRLLEERGICR